ncbi:MAG: hypothetical protein GC179_29120 [Anaerolineaceae bacterium]|nr:hypothetical protein [Anaerolineaceae bacterium]
MGNTALIEGELDKGVTEIPIETVQAALQNGASLEPDIRQQYAERLLDFALESRDPAASSIAAQLMDKDPSLDKVLDSHLNTVVQHEPDAVYAFIRAHLVDQCNQVWIERLQLAATAALKIAITDSAPSTTMDWLTLIGREPAKYELGEILHDGLLAAQDRAHHEPELARVLITLAAKRDAAVLEQLLDDKDFMAALPNNIGLVMRDFSGDPLALLQNRGLELFMVGMSRAAQACASELFTPAAIAGIWELYAGGQPIASLPPQYQADHIIQLWLERGVKCLNVEALESLAIQILTSRRDDLFLQLLHQENGAKVILPRLIFILERSHRTIEDAMNLIGRIVTAGDMLPQEAAATYIQMLNGLEWQKETLPLIQQLARTLTKHTDLALPPEILWRMLGIGSERKDELVTKTAVKRLLGSIATIEDDTDLIESLRRLTNDTSWSAPIQDIIIDWWRRFIRQQPASRITRLDKGLEGKRGLEEARSVLQTLGSVRKMMSSHNMPEFAQAVHTTYTVLEALSDAFDPNSKRNINFDPETARAELDAQADMLSPQDRQVLANNLRELALMIASMGDNRTRANLMRRGDNVDRELMKGEELPHSAVDAMKWLAGYWGGTQEDDGDSP